MLTHLLLLSHSLCSGKIMGTTEYPGHRGHLRIGSEAWTTCAGQTWSNGAFLSRSGSGTAGRDAELERIPSWNHKSQLFAVFPKITSLRSTPIFRSPFQATIAQKAITANHSVRRHMWDSGPCHPNPLLCSTTESLLLLSCDHHQEKESSKMNDNNKKKTQRHTKCKL